MNLLESYQQTYTYDTGNNLTCLSHKTNSSTWQQNISLHPNSNRGTETNHSTSDFDADGNLLTLSNIATLDWHYNNTLNKLTKQDKTTTKYYVYDYQGKRVRTVLESNQTIQSQRDYLPALDISSSGTNQQTNTLHITAHIFSQTTKDTIESRYQLSSHLHSNTLELNDKAQIISYEHYYPYGGTALIAGTDKTQVRQKRYRYTGKERDDSSGLSNYGARYLAPWLARWISPDSARNVDGLNLYVYVDNNPLKYVDLTGHIPTIDWDDSMLAINTYMNTQKLNLWIGESHSKFEGRNLLLQLDRSIHHKRNLVFENVLALKGESPISWSQANTKLFEVPTFNISSGQYVALEALAESTYKLTQNRKSYYVGTEGWNNVALDEQKLKNNGLEGSSDFLVGVSHVLSHELSHVGKKYAFDKNSAPVYWHFDADIGIALVPRKALNSFIDVLKQSTRSAMQEDEFGVWVKGEDGSIKNAILVLGKEPIMKSIFGNVVEKIPHNLYLLNEPSYMTKNFKLPTK